MSSNSQNYDISLSNNIESNETELVDVKADTSTNKDSGYAHLNNNENEATISTEYEENNDNNEDFSDLKQQFNNSGIINNPLVVKKEPNKEIKYRKGNLYIFCYGKNGVPKIVIGPDCKLYYIIFYIIRGLCCVYAIVHSFNNIFILYWIMEIFEYFH